MVLELSFRLALIALRMARSAFSHFSRSVALGALPQVQKTSSQLRLREGTLAIQFLATGRSDEMRLFTSVRRVESAGTRSSVKSLRKLVFKPMNQTPVGPRFTNKLYRTIIVN